MEKKALLGHLNASICVFFIAFCLFVMARPVEASTLTWSLDDYSTGTIGGQHQWEGNALINTDRATSSPNSLSFVVGAYGSYASTTLSGINNFNNFNYWFIPAGLYDYTQPVILFKDLSNHELFIIYISNFIGEGSQWNFVNTEIDQVNYKYKINYNGTTTEWIDWDYPGIISGMEISASGVVGAITYIDSFSFSINCGDFKNRSDCIANKCYWENIIFQEEYSYCRDFPSDPNSFCENSIFNCAYCNASTTCLGVGCYWNEIKGCSYFENTCTFQALENCPNKMDCENASGTWNGDFCFSSAVKEDCSSMDLLPKMVCQIKNFLASMFLPSKTKLSELGRTIDLINTKFPSNYLKATKSFFDDIKNGINETGTGIPVKILGHEKTINFDIFNATGTAGGVSQSFGGFIKIFFTIAILVPFISWAINFMTRIFK